MNSDRKSQRIPTGLLPSRRAGAAVRLPNVGRVGVGRLTAAPRLPRKPVR